MKRINKTLHLFICLCLFMLFFSVLLTIPSTDIKISAATKKTESAAKKKYKKKLKTLAKKHSPKNYDNGWLTGDRVMKDLNLADESAWWKEFPIHYSYVDIDGNGVSELIVLIRQPWVYYADAAFDGNLYIYRYTKGKVKEVYSRELNTSSAVSSSSYSRSFSLYKNGFTVTFGDDGSSTEYYKYTGKKSELFAKSLEDWNGAITYSIYRDGIKSSVIKNDFESTIKNFFNSAAEIKVKWKNYK